MHHILFTIQQSVHIWTVPTLWLSDNAAVNIFAQVFVWTNVFICLGSVPRTDTFIPEPLPAVEYFW